MDNTSRAFSVSQVNEYIKMMLESTPVLSDIYVRGEISNFKDNYKSGHLYFSLKDNEALIRAVMFSSYASRLAFRPQDGMKVIAHGRVSAYPRDGQYQIYIDSMQPDGLGSLYMAYEQLKAKLAGDGLFDEDRKKPLPQFPKKIGIITSPTGAAVRDMIDVTGRRYPIADILLFPALVQGKEAVQSLITGLKYFNFAKNVDVIIIGRGGGSIEDLWAFNDEGLARCIASSEIPVISAVGHETDYTICDFVADKRAPTPSAAAEIAVPDIRGIVNFLGESGIRINSVLSSMLKKYKDELLRLAESGVMKSPTGSLELRKMDILTYETRLNNGIDRIKERKSAELKALIHSMTGLNPLSVLDRGYGEVETPDGKVISSASEITSGDVIKVRFSDGAVTARAESVDIRKERQNG